MINKANALIMQKICRSCMCEGAPMKSVFETKGAEDGQTFKLSDMLMACSSIQITSNDGLPFQLCLSCESKLVSAFEFKQQCEKTDTTLRELVHKTISKHSIKQESLNIVVKPDVELPSYLNDEAESDTSDAAGPKSPAAEDSSFGFTCSYCQKVLRTKKGLTIHQRRHTGEKLRACHICQAKFTRTNHLRRHLETHKKSNPNATMHVCVECDASFNKAYHLMKHKKEQHKGGNVRVKKEMDGDMDVDDDGDPLDGIYDDVEIEVAEDGKDDEENSGTKQRRNSMRARNDNDEKQIDKEKKIMQCEFCDRQFKYRKSFIHHMQTEHGMSDESDVPLSTYITKSDIVKHETVENIDTTNANLASAMDEGELKDVLNTDISNEGFEGLDDSDLLLMRSMRKLHSCHVCDSKFKRANHLTRHMTLHRAVLIHKCDRCDKAFATPEFLTKHTQEAHIDKPYVCTICDKPFTRGEHLIRHLKLHNTDRPDENLKCSICERTFARSDHLARHTKVHLQHDKRHVCPECGKAFNRLDNLKTHQRIHTGLKDNSRLHLCIYCGKEFNNSSNMIVHMRRHTGERPYKCTYCSKGFPRSHDLKCHERTHSGEKPYLCTLCGKSFNKSNKLLRHTRVHTGERPYVCNLCGRAFTQSNDLALHMRRHTGSRPYACGACPARFIQSGQLKAHRRSTGHWMDIQPDLKGAHRVEPVTPISNPAPIKFKTHGKHTFKSKEEDMTEAEMKEPRILNQSIGIMGNVVHNDTLDDSQPIVIESTKLLQQFHSAGFVGLSSVINAAAQASHDQNKFKAEVQTYIANVGREGAAMDSSKLEIASGSDVTFTAMGSASTTYTSPERYNYQNYG